MAEGHRSRVRNRFLTDDTNELPEGVIMEAYLHSIIPRRDTHDLANRLLKEFGSFTQVVDAPLEALMEVEGVGKTVATQIKMLPAYLRRYVKGKFSCIKAIVTSDDAGEVLLPYFIGETKEVVYVMCLNNMGKLLGCKRLCEGSLSAVPITVRNLLAAALQYHATGIILAHNHPFGVALPSTDDIAVTRKLKETLFDSEVVLVDHLVFDGGDFVSVRDSSNWTLWPCREYTFGVGER